MLRRYLRSSEPQQRCHHTNPAAAITTLLLAARRHKPTTPRVISGQDPAWASEALPQSDSDPYFQFEMQNAADFKRERQSGRVYRKMHHLWPSLAAMERDMTQAAFAPAERLPPELLPREVAELQLEGRVPKPLAGRQLLLLEKEEEQPKQQQHQPQTTMTMLKEKESDSAAATTTTNNNAADANDDDDAMFDLAAMQVLEIQQSNAQRDREKQFMAAQDDDDILGDLHSNSADAVASWDAAGLDPELAHRAAELIGRGVTRCQSRLLPALTNEDHNDVVFGSVTGSGKTVALLLAILQGIRKETSGINVFVASDSVNAARAVDFVHRMGGPLIADCEDNSDHWVMLADRREMHAEYKKQLLQSLEFHSGGANEGSTNGGTRLLICTADVLCELLFEHKFEFVPFGNLRRLYVDDVSKDIRFASETASFEDKLKEYSEPSATQLALGTVHQLMPPDQRSLLQLGVVAADMESTLSQHLMSLCVKPHANTLIACTARLPATIHCVFSFYSQRASPVLVSPVRQLLSYLNDLLKNAASAIPGRVLIFFPSDYDLVEMRALLLKHHGMDAKLLFEVLLDGDSSSSSSSSWASGWRFLLLHEHEGFGLDIPLVSHVVLTFCPRNRFSLLHLAGRAGRAGRPGWCFTVVPRQDAPHVAAVCKELDVNVANNTVDVRLNNVPPETVKRWADPPTQRSVLDPQDVVEKRYDRYDEASYYQPTMFNHARDPAKRKTDMMLMDWTPTPVLQRRFEQARKLQRDIAETPEVAIDMAKQGLLDADTLRPTRKLLEIFDAPGNASVMRTQLGKAQTKGWGQEKKWKRKISRDAQSLPVSDKTW